MNNLNTMPHDMPTSAGQPLCRPLSETRENHKQPGSSGGKSDSAKAWMYTPSATESRTLLKQAIIQGLGTGEVSEAQAKSLFSKYDLAGL